VHRASKELIYDGLEGYIMREKDVMGYTGDNELLDTGRRRGKMQLKGQV
jgi:hypothetical protein